MNNYISKRNTAQPSPIKRTGFIVLFLVMLFHRGYSAARDCSIRFEHFSLQEGLSQASVRCIVQDDQGFLWFGTEDGLNRYDGYAFKVFKNDPDNSNSLSHNSVEAMIKDRSGNLWIGTDSGGLNKYNPRTGIFTRYRHDPSVPASLGHYSVKVIFEDRSGTIWVGTQGDILNRLNPRTGIFTHFNIPPGSSNPNRGAVYTLWQDPAGYLWIGGNNGLDRLDPKAGTFKKYMVEFICCSWPDHKNHHRLWIGTEANGLYCLDAGSGDIGHCPYNAGTRSKSDNPSIYALFQDKEGPLWIGTKDHGLYRWDYSANTFSHFVYHPQKPYNLSNNTIYSLYRDQGGILWIGTAERGIDKLDPRTTAFSNFFHDPNNRDSLSDNSVGAIFEDRNGLLWIGTEAGLDRYDFKSDTFSHFRHDPANPASISHNSVIAIREDRFIPGRLWIGTYKGLNQWNPRTKEFLRFFHIPGRENSLSDDSISALYSEPGGKLWIGTLQSGIDCLDSRTGNFSHSVHEPGNPNTLSDNCIYFFHRHRSGAFWIGTANGLNKYNPETQTYKYFFKTDPQKPLGRIISICEDPGGVLWVGTWGSGLIRFDPSDETSTRFGAKEGLLNDIVYGILQDDLKNLWLSTNNGLFKLNPQSLRFDHYDVRDGLPGNEFNTRAYHHGYSGRMYFGGIDGFTAFYPHRVKNNPHLPPVAITRLLEFNREKPLDPPVTSLKVLELSHKQKVFSFEFTALDFAAPEKNRYMYKMERFNQNWLSADSNQRVATYTNLDPGVYTFMVKASNNHGLWNESPTQLKVIITPPFWDTPWFKLSAVLFILILIYLVYRVRVRVIHAQKKQLEEEVNKRTLALKEANERAELARTAAEDASRSKSDFLARMSHEIRTPMNSIIGFTDMLLETNLDDIQYDFVRTINHSGDALLTLIDDILDFSKVESGLLTLESTVFDPEEIAYDTCKMIHPRIGNRPVEILYRIDDNVPAHVKGDMSRFRQVLVNLLGNAVKFTEKGEIELSITVEKEGPGSVTLHTRVRDSGIGIPKDKFDTIFEVFQQVDGSITRRFGGSGLGLAICRQISRLMHGDIWVESELNSGSTFHFTAVMDKVEEKPSDETREHLFSNLRILIVDDNRHNLDILSHILTKEGFIVTALSRGEDVVYVLNAALDSQSPFRLCILDIQMPGLSGYEVAKQIRELPVPISSLPLLAFSSSTASRSKLYLDFGFDAFISKPARRKELLEIIKKLLKGERLKPGTPGEKIPASPPVSPDKVKPSRVLLAEDNPINRKLANFILLRAGYRVDIAENGRETLDKFLSDPDKYDLILMDVQMPGIGGLEAVKILREKGFTRIPVIAITAQSMKGDREKCLEAGMNDYVSKPIRKEAFLETLKKWTSN